MRRIYTCIRCRSPLIKTGEPAMLFHQATMSEVCTTAMAAIDESVASITEFEMFDRVTIAGVEGVGTVTDIRAGVWHPLVVTLDDGRIADCLPSNLKLV